MNNITFTNLWSDSEPPLPTPAKFSLPDWYKKTSTYVPDEVLNEIGVRDPLHPVKGSIKQCMPVFDALTLGYILHSPADLVITQQDGQPFYEWYGKTIPLGWHPKQQAESHPLANTEVMPKWLNPWGIQTPEGYSCLFTHPLHRDDLPFTTFAGVVDTDNYVAAVALPFALKNPKFEGYIPAGTPICQVIPFKREKWGMSFGTEEDKKIAIHQSWKLRKLKEFRYKYGFWNKKDFK